jgi:hypothetical protein
MARRNKPVGVLVVGIINMVLGGLSLLTYGALCVCGVGLALIFRSLYQTMPPQDQKVLDPLWPIFRDNIPGLVPAVIIGVIVSLLLSVMHVIAGWGCVRIKQWGRWTSVVWGVLHVFVLTASLVYMLAVFYPGTQKMYPELDRWLDKIEAEQRAKGQPVQQRTKFANSGTGNVIADNIMGILITLVEIGYSAFVAVFMALPATGRAIDRYNRPDGDAEAPQRDSHEYYDDDYERQRRTLGEPGDAPDQPTGERSDWQAPGGPPPVG